VGGAPFFIGKIVKKQSPGDVVIFNIVPTIFTFQKHHQNGSQCGVSVFFANLYPSLQMNFLNITPIAKN
jgi:hypothetical protein